MASYEFTGADPIDHFVIGRVNPGDVVELDADPGPPWKTARKRHTKAPVSTERGSDVPNSPKED